MSFFTSFVAAFAMAALVPVVRQNLDLTSSDLGDSGKRSVCKCTHMVQEDIGHAGHSKEMQVLRIGACSTLTTPVGATYLGPQGYICLQVLPMIGPQISNG